MRRHAERFVGSIRRECLNKLVILGERHLRRAVSEFVEHYHTERHHQGLSGELIEGEEAGSGDGAIVCSERLGGMLKFYSREAA